MSRLQWIPLVLTCAFPLPAQVAIPQGAKTINALGSNEAYNLAADWIFDSDARHRAWAAALIARYRFAPLYPDLLTALKSLLPLASETFSGTPDQLALEAVADALVQSRMTVPAANARDLYAAFPALGMILLSRTLDDSHPALLSLFERVKVPEVWLAAANLLAADPPPGFVPKLLDDVRVVVRILLTTPNTGRGMSYGDCFGASSNADRFRIPPEWPAFSVYALQYGSVQYGSVQSGKGGGTILAQGSTPVTFVAREVAGEVDSPWTGHPSCGDITIERFRLALLRQLAGTESGSPPLEYLTDRALVVESDWQFQRSVIEIVQAQQVLFRALVAQLQAKGLLTPAEAIERRLHMVLHVVPLHVATPTPQLPDLSSLGIVFVQ